MAGFRFKYMEGGGVVYLTSFVVKSGASISKGDLCKITSGEVELASSGETTIFGVAANDAVGGELVRLYPPDSIYASVDGSARNCGDGLDINATSDGVTTKTNCDLVVVRNSTAGEDTLVRLHYSIRLFDDVT